MSVNYTVKKKVYEIIWMGGDLREWFSPVMFHRKDCKERERVKERGGKHSLHAAGHFVYGRIRHISTCYFHLVLF